MVQFSNITKYNTVFEPGCRIIYGIHAASGYILQAAAEIAVKQPLHLLDFGNRCDMYFVARQLRYLTHDPVAAMRNIRLQRAFTCYQSLALLREIDRMELGLPVFILDLLAPFLDENIKKNEIMRLFSESVEQLRCALRTRLLLIGVKPVPQKLAPDRVCLVENLAREFGLIRLENGSSGSGDSTSGYRLRPASRAFPSGGSALAKPQRAELMDGQPTLFDCLPEVSEKQL